MDDEPAHDYSAMMDNPETHWDQPLRFLPRELRVARGEHILVATGSRPRTPPNVPVDHEHILDSDSLLSTVYVPESMTVWS